MLPLCPPPFFILTSFPHSGESRAQSNVPEGFLVGLRSLPCSCGSSGTSAGLSSFYEPLSHAEQYPHSVLPFPQNAVRRGQDTEQASVRVWDNAGAWRQAVLQQRNVVKAIISHPSPAGRSQLRSLSLGLLSWLSSPFESLLFYHCQLLSPKCLFASVDLFGSPSALKPASGKSRNRPSVIFLNESHCLLLFPPSAT